MHKKILLLVAVTLVFAAGISAQMKFDPKLFTYEEHVDNKYVGKYTFQTNPDYFNLLYALDVNLDQATGEYYGVGVDKEKNAAYYFNTNRKTNYFSVNMDTGERSLKSVDKVAVTKSGMIYIIDSIENIIACWDSKGDSFNTVNKIYGDFRNLEDIFTDESDNLYFLDNGFKRIYKYSTNINDFTPINPSGNFYIPYKKKVSISWGQARGIIVKNENIYIVFERGKIVRINNNGDIVNEITLNKTNIGLMSRSSKELSETWLESIALGPFGNVYVLDSKAGLIHALSEDLNYLSSWSDPEYPIEETASDICFARGMDNLFITHPWGFNAFKVKPQLAGAIIDKDYFYPDYVCPEYPGLNIDLSVIGRGSLSINLKNKESSDSYTIVQKSLSINESFHYLWTGKNIGSYSIPYGENTVEFYLDGELIKEIPLSIIAPPEFTLSGEDDQLLDPDHSSLTYSIVSDSSGIVNIWIPEEETEIPKKPIDADQAEVCIIEQEENLKDLFDGEYSLRFSVLPRGLADLSVSGLYQSKQIHINNTVLEISEISTNHTGLNPNNSNFETIIGSFTSNEGGHVSVSLIDKDEKLIKEIFKNKYVSAGVTSFEWDGRDAENSTVKDGDYCFAIQFWQKKPETAISKVSTFFEVDTTAPVIHLSDNSKTEYFISPDEPSSIGLKDDIGITDNENVLSFSYNENTAVNVDIRDYTGRTIKSIITENHFNADLDCFIQWDGTDDYGLSVPDGKYTISVDATDTYGNKADNDLIVWVDNNKIVEGVGEKILSPLEEEITIRKTENNISLPTIGELIDGYILVWNESTVNEENVIHGQIYNSVGELVFDEIVIENALYKNIDVTDKGFIITFEQDFQSWYQKFDLQGVMQGERVHLYSSDRVSVRKLSNGFVVFETQVRPDPEGIDLPIYISKDIGISNTDNLIYIVEPSLPEVHKWREFTKMSILDNIGGVIAKKSDIGYNPSVILSVHDGFFLAVVNGGDDPNIVMKKCDNNGNEQFSLIVTDSFYQYEKPRLILNNNIIYFFWTSKIGDRTSLFMSSFDTQGNLLSDSIEFFSQDNISSYSYSLVNFNEYFFIMNKYYNINNNLNESLGQYYNFQGNNFGYNYSLEYNTSSSIYKSGKKKIALVSITLVDGSTEQLDLQLYEEIVIGSNNLIAKIISPLNRNYETKVNFDLSGYALDSNIERINVLYNKEGNSEISSIYSAYGQNINGKILTFDTLSLDKGINYELKLEAWDKAANYRSDSIKIIRPYESEDFIKSLSLNNTYSSMLSMPKVSFDLIDTADVKIVVRDENETVKKSLTIGSVKEKQNYELDISGLSDGKYKIELLIDYENNEYSSYLSLDIDNTPPILNLADFGTAFSNNSYVKLTANVDEVNLKNYSVLLTDHNHNIITTLKEGQSSGKITDILFFPLAIEEGTYTIELKAEDYGGNKSSITRSFNIDRTGPEINLLSPLVNSVNSDFLDITGTFSDPAAIENYKLVMTNNEVSSTLYEGTADSINYSLDTTLYSEEVIEVELEIIAFDKLGNKSSLKRKVVVDNKAPETVLTYNLQPATVDNSKYTDISNAIVLSAESGDSYSQVKSIQYSINNGPWAEYQNPILTGTEGVYTIQYYAIDTTGNSSTVLNDTIIVDNTNPDCSIIIEDPKFEKDTKIIIPFNNNISIVPDDGNTAVSSGISFVKYSFDQQNWFDYDGSQIQIINEGSVELYIKVVDNVGNQIIKPIANLIIDNAPPQTLWESDVEFYSSSQSNIIALAEEGYITLQAADTDTGILNSGIKEILYSFENINFTYSEPIFISDENIYDFHFYSEDNVGNIESRDSVKISVDNEPPVVHLSSVRDSFTENKTIYSKSGNSFSLDAVDNFSGVGDIYYNLDDFEFVSYDNPFYFSKETDVILNYFAEDNLNTRSSIETVNISIDDTPPSTVLFPNISLVKIDDQLYADTRYTFHFPSQDSKSGVAETFVIVNGENVDADIFSIEGEGNYIISYYSVDNVGNLESIENISIISPIPDITPPVSTLEYSYDPYVENDVYYFRSDVELTISSEDILGENESYASGLDRVFFAYDNNSFTQYEDSIISFAEGDHQLLFYAVDNVGNNEVVNKIDITIDDTSPVSSIIIPESEQISFKGNIYLNESDAIEIHAFDQASGLDKIYYRFSTGGAWLEYTGPISVADGEYALEYYSSDKLGNTETPGLVKLIVVKDYNTVSYSIEKKYNLYEQIRSIHYSNNKVAFVLDSPVGHIYTQNSNPDQNDLFKDRSQITQSEKYREEIAFSNDYIASIETDLNNSNLYLYDADLTNQSGLQLTFSGQNISPRIVDDKLLWIQTDNNISKIMEYDLVLKNESVLMSTEGIIKKSQTNGDRVEFLVENLNNDAIYVYSDNLLQEVFSFDKDFITTFSTNMNLFALENTGTIYLYEQVGGKNILKRSFDGNNPILRDNSIIYLKQDGNTSFLTYENIGNSTSSTITLGRSVKDIRLSTDGYLSFQIKDDTNKPNQFLNLFYELENIIPEYDDGFISKCDIFNFVILKYEVQPELIEDIFVNSKSSGFTVNKHVNKGNSIYSDQSIIFPDILEPFDGLTHIESASVSVSGEDIFSLEFTSLSELSLYMIVEKGLTNSLLTYGFELENWSVFTSPSRMWINISDNEMFDLVRINISTGEFFNLNDIKPEKFPPIVFIADKSLLVPQTEQWVSGQSYSSDDLVLYHGQLYQAEYWTTSEPGTDNSWKKIDTGADFMEWDNSQQYDTDEIIIFNGFMYKAKWWTSGDSPVDGDPWKCIATDSNPQVWDHNQTYQAGEVIFNQNNLYKNKWWSRGDNPSDGDPWKLIPSNSEILLWVDTQTYNGSEIVFYEGILYQALWYTKGDIPGTSLYGPWQAVE